MAEEARKVRGLGVYPRKILKNRCSEIAPESINICQHIRSLFVVFVSCFINFVFNTVVIIEYLTH